MDSQGHQSDRQGQRNGRRLWWRPCFHGPRDIISPRGQLVQCSQHPTNQNVGHYERPSVAEFYTRKKGKNNHSVQIEKFIFLYTDQGNHGFKKIKLMYSVHLHTRSHHHNNNVCVSPFLELVPVYIGLN